MTEAQRELKQIQRAERVSGRDGKAEAYYFAEVRAVEIEAWDGDRTLIFKDGSRLQMTEGDIA